MPEVITNNHHMISAGLVFTGSETSPKHRFRAEQVEKVGANSRTLYVFGFTNPGEDGRSGTDHRYFL